MTQQLFQDKPIEQRRKEVRQVVARMLKAYGFEQTKALASQFNCTYGAVKNWGTNGRLPTDPMFQCHMETGASIDWLLNGKSPLLEFDQDMVNTMNSSIEAELRTGARYNLITQDRPDGIKQLAAGITDNLIEKLQINLVKDKTIKK